jgi:hypothetical protein
MIELRDLSIFLTNFFFFNSSAISSKENHCTQFLYQFPPKLPLRQNAAGGGIRYNIYEKKALAPKRPASGHLARKLLIQMQAR